MNRDAVKNFSLLAETEIKRGAAEDKLRHLLSANLCLIFPDNPWWVQEHILGTETFLHFSNVGGRARIGFADSVVGKTAIEYEKNLTVLAIFEEGYYQVKEYCAALCNLGIPEKEIYGVLSDTVRWYGYTIRIIENKRKNQLFGAEDIELIQTDFVDLSNWGDTEISNFEYFTNKYFDRKESRLLNGKALSLDFGTESLFYKREIHAFQSVVQKAVKEKPVYADLIRNVWQNFVAYLGASDYGKFSEETYVNEFYLIVVAKVLCADILNGSPMISSDAEIRNILNGTYFKRKNILNFVDYDYFGWLNSSPYAECLIPHVKEMQKQLACYDFTLLTEEDLFGELLAQLSKREHRLLLGQDFTPHWVAKEMVKDIVETMKEEPHMLDMCCGSGVFLIETIKKVRDFYDIRPEVYDEKKDNIIFTCAMGFDIDPLAVVLAKVNWILAMRDLFKVHVGIITIPIYHADSLFTATPVSHGISALNGSSYVLEFEGNKVIIPSYMLTPEHRKTFDAFMSKCYGLAMARASKCEAELTELQLDKLVSAVELEANIVQTPEEISAQRFAAYALVLQLEKLQREGKNGIWYFILNNSYRPELMKKQFNCIISNPPWLAMSRMADNPYKKDLMVKNDNFGIKPPGSSHLHMELASTFLLASVDKYLKDGARWMCVMPGSLMSGYQHEPFRREKYRNAKNPIQMSIDTIWELPIDTFKNKAIVVGGLKEKNNSHYPLMGRIYADRNQYITCKYTLNIQGKRSAWTNKGDHVDVIDLINTEAWPFAQGADIFPRTVVFHKYSRNANGTWMIQKIEKNSELYYLISDSKKELCNDLNAEGICNKYLFDCLMSKHVSPFIVSSPAKALLPGYKEEGRWKAITDEEFAFMDAATAAVFEEIQEKMEMPLNIYLEEKINMRGKLSHQDWSFGRWLVLSNAGGSNPCAAYLDLETVDKKRLIIDQTLYWYLAGSEEEAVYITAMINSEALNWIIKEFQPEGGFGKRHIHTLPYKVIPRYEKGNTIHEDVVSAAEKLIASWKACCEKTSIGQYINPNSGTLNQRRSKQQAALKKLPEYIEYEEACAAAMGVE